MEKFFDQRKEHVAKFISMYLAFNQLSKESGYDESEDMNTGETVSLSPSNPFDTQLECGQIRLLSKTTRITYVVLLKRWERDSFVVMPFSNFKFPATEEEFLTEYDGGLFMRVLQAWNTRTLQDQTLENSWLIGHLPQKDLDDAWKMWEASLGGKTVEDTLLMKTGLPIYHSNDPRLAYKQSELENFARIDAEDLALIGVENVIMSDDNDSCSLFLGQYVNDYALAAGEEKQNLQFNYVLEDKSIVCFAEYSQHDKTFSFHVNTSDGQKSMKLDNYRLVEKSTGEILGVIQNGMIKFKYNLTSNSNIQILDSNGIALLGDLEKI